MKTDASYFFNYIKSYALLFIVLTFRGYAQAPVASFTSSTVKCSGQIVIFTDQSSNSPTAWNWSFPGGNPSSSSVQNPTVNYALAGIYTITVFSSVTNFTGSAITQTIYIAPSPTVSISSSSPNCFWESRTLTASGANTYTWYPGALTGSTVVVPSPIFTTMYTLIATTASCNVNLPYAVVHVVTSTQTTDTIVACNNDPGVTITTSTMFSSSETYSWSTGNTGSVLVVSPPTNQTYSLYVKGNNNQCFFKLFQVQVLPNPTITINTATICAGSSTVLCANGASQYIWSPSTGLNYTVGPCPTANPSINTTYTVVGLTSCTAITTVSVNVMPRPTLSVTSATLCAGESQSICVSGASSYTWNAAQGINSYSVSCPYVNPVQSTTYAVTGTGQNGCTASAVAFVYVNTCTTLSHKSQLENGFDIYPNPNNGIFFVKHPVQNEKTEFELYNALGEKVYDKTIFNEISEIEFKPVKGMYYARIINAKTCTQIQKILVE